MRWRNSAVYLLVLLLIGGYFYYFDVLKKAEKEADEKAARRVFVFKPDSVGVIEVRSGEAKAVRIEKKDGWHIVDPVKSDVDWPIFERLFQKLQELHFVRKLGAGSEKTASYGLAKPHLDIRFQAGGQWMELLVGDANPSGDSRYAKKGSGNEVFLIDRLDWESLDKGLKDLRKKDLFAWQTDQVAYLDVKWKSGAEVRYERQGKEWKAAGQPEMQIKGKKLESLLDQIHWLRATDFLDESAKPNPPAVTVVIGLKDGKTSELALADPYPKTNLAAATVTGFPSPVTVSTNFMAELPKSAADYRDCSLMSQSTFSDVRAVKWKCNGKEGELVSTDGMKWATAAGKKPLDNPTAVLTLIAEVSRTDYADTTQTGTDLSGAGSSYLELLGEKNRSLCSLAWAALPKGDKEKVAARLEKDGKTMNVTIEHSSMKRLNDELQKLAAAASVQAGAVKKP